MYQINEFGQIFLGILLLIGMHTIAIAFILFLSMVGGGTSILIIWFYLFLFWQLLYVIPVCLWLKRNRKQAMMKGVIIGAVITALLSCGCYLLMLTDT